MKMGRYIAVLGVALLLGAGALYAVAPQARVEAQELTPEQRAELQAQYDQLQKEIEQYQKIIDDTKAKANTIQGDVTILDAQVRKAQAEINQRTSSINTLASTINQKSKTIATLETRLEDGRASLAKLLREKSLNALRQLETVQTRHHDVCEKEVEAPPVEGQAVGDERGALEEGEVDDVHVGRSRRQARRRGVAPHHVVDGDGLGRVGHRRRAGALEHASRF